LSGGFGQYSEMFNLDGRSTRALHAAMGLAKEVNDQLGFDLLQVTGLSDRNHDGLDDNTKLAVRSWTTNSCSDPMKSSVSGGTAN
jgi:hypothetical protein